MKSLWYQCNGVRSERNHCGINVTVSGQTPKSLWYQCNGVRSERNHCGINVTVSQEISVVSM